MSKKEINDVKTAGVTSPENEAHEMTEEEMAAKVDEVMKKYDRESNTRIWEGVPK